MYAEELATDRADTEAVGAIRSYGPGRLVVGLAGPAGPTMAERFAVLLRELHVLSRRELVLTFEQLTRSGRGLPRVIDRARTAHLVEGGRVEVHDPPPQPVRPRPGPGR